ncbi:MAG: helix-turn-helix transcriptional regulator [Planctomycetota bacterium]|jgi:excisionase family DNA binding protein
MQLMSIEDLAVYLGDSKRTIYKYIASGDCPPYMRISGKNIKFDRADVDAWLESKKIVPQHDAKPLPKKPLPWMPRAKQVVTLAQAEAKDRKLEYVGTEHLLFGIIAVEDCIGAIALNNLGVHPVKFQETYERLCSNTPGPVSSEQSGGKPVGMNTSRMAIRCATDEAVRLGHKYIGTEHLLVGILLVHGGLGHQVLEQLGIALDLVRNEITKLIVCPSVKEK